MTRLLPALHEGHAPVHLHLAFEEALEAFENWGPGQPEPSVGFDGRFVAVSAVFGRMRTCSDLLPMRTLLLVRDVVGPRAKAFDDLETTYAQVALLLRALCIEKLRSGVY